MENIYPWIRESHISCYSHFLNVFFIKFIWPRSKVFIVLGEIPQLLNKQESKAITQDYVQKQRQNASDFWECSYVNAHIMSMGL